MTNNSTTVTEGFASMILWRRGDLFNDSMNVGDYILDFVSRLDERFFGEIDDGEGYLALHGQHGEERLTRVAWLRNCKHSGRRGMETIKKFGTATDMPFVHCREKEAYELRLSRLVRDFVETLVTKDLVIVKAVNVLKLVFDLPFDSLWFIRCHCYWAKDQDF